MNMDMIAIKIYLDKSLIEKNKNKEKFDEHYLHYVIDALSEPP